jgi:membrane-bound lytic murein transglycosylase A
MSKALIRTGCLMMWKPHLNRSQAATLTWFAKARIGLLIGLGACVSAPPPVSGPPESVQTEPAPASDTSLADADAQQAPAPYPRPVPYNTLPGWDQADLMPAATAFARTCALWANRAADAPVSRRVGYAGTVGEWAGACAALETISDSSSARLVFEALFTPLEILPGDRTPKFTGYFEPQFTARRTPQYPYTQPVPGVPADLVQVDRSELGGEPGRKVPAQRRPNGELRPYPPRAEIALDTRNVLGYAHPADVFFLQIQGSGRLVFEDGKVLRAAYAAHNGQPFGSTANYLLERGEITRGEASMQGIRAWMDRVPREKAQEAMNFNPRFVFFRPVPVGDPSLGPVGAHTVPLTPLGSMAIDPSVNALGVPFFITTTSPGLGGDWSGLLIGQDTGGAIKGRVRGDIYFGTGDDAGRRAGTQNAEGRMWAFLPRAVADRLIERAGPES